MRTMKIHPTNRIHETAYIEEGAQIGQNNYFGPFSYVHSCVVIGNDCRFEGHCSIGTPPEHKSFHLNGDNCGVLIGNNVVIKEFVTVNRGTTQTTTIQDDVWMLRGSHAGHDSLIMKDAVISCNVMIGGHSVVMDNANVGLGAVIHQNRCIGSYCMIGMGSVVTKSIKPFMVAYGSPAKPTKLNDIGMKRGGFTDNDILDLAEYQEDIKYNQLYPVIVPAKIKSAVDLWKKMEGGTSALHTEKKEKERVCDDNIVSPKGGFDNAFQPNENISIRVRQ